MVGGGAAARRGGEAVSGEAAGGEAAGGEWWTEYRGNVGAWERGSVGGVCLILIWTICSPFTEFISQRELRVKIVTGDFLVVK